jgi:hypothetical protein
MAVASRQVLPHLRDLWDDQGENLWWPERLRAKRQLASAAAT